MVCPLSKCKGKVHKNKRVRREHIEMAKTLDDDDRGSKSGDSTSVNEFSSDSESSGSTLGRGFSESHEDPVRLQRTRQDEHNYDAVVDGWEVENGERILRHVEIPKLELTKESEVVINAAVPFLSNRERTEVCSCF